MVPPPATTSMLAVRHVMERDGEQHQVDQDLAVSKQHQVQVHLMRTRTSRAGAVGFGRIVALEKEASTLFMNLV